ncbi:MAG TPA: hypothetical protein VHH15_16290 [Actinophytocola sp.]|nr:hypothetical protein [Actinophytocola sp.]
MLRHRPHRGARGVMLHPATGWVALAVLYLAAVVLNVLLAASTEEFWPLALAVVLGAGSVACATAAARSLRR